MKQVYGLSNKNLKSNKFKRYWTANMRNMLFANMMHPAGAANELLSTLWREGLKACEGGVNIEKLMDLMEGVAKEMLACGYVARGCEGAFVSVHQLEEGGECNIVVICGATANYLESMEVVGYRRNDPVYIYRSIFKENTCVDGERMGLWIFQPGSSLCVVESVAKKEEYLSPERFWVSLDLS